MELVTFDCGFCEEDVSMAQFNLVETRWGSTEWCCDRCLTVEDAEILQVLE